MLRYVFHGIPLESEISLPEVVRSAARGPGVLIERADFPIGPRVDWFHRWQITAGSHKKQQHTWMSFGRQDGGYLLRIADLADFQVSSAGNRIRCRAVDGVPDATLRHLLLDQILPLALSQAGHLVLHASAVHVPRFGAIAFAGNAGAGKSTLAAALTLRGCQLVSDDSLLMSIERSAPIALPAYPGVRLWSDSSRSLQLGRSATTEVAHYTRKKRVSGASLPFRERSSPVRVIFVLGRRRTATLPSRARKLTLRDGLVSLVRYTYLLDVDDRHHLSRMFGSLATVVSRVPVLRLDVRHAGTSLARAAVEVLDLARRAVDS